MVGKTFPKLLKDAPFIHISCEPSISSPNPQFLPQDLTSSRKVFSFLLHKGMLTKKAKLFDSGGEERRGSGSKGDGIRVEDKQLCKTVEFERMESIEKMHGWFLGKSVSQESDGILEVGIQGKEKGEVGSGSEPTEEYGVSQRSESVKEASYANGKAELDFDLNYPIADATTIANHGIGYKIVNNIITIDSDSREDDSLNGDGESHGRLDVGGQSFELGNNIGRSESSSYGKESSFAAKKLSNGKYDEEKAQVHENDEDKLEIGLGLLPFNPKSRD